MPIQSCGQSVSAWRGNRYAETSLLNRHMVSQRTKQFIKMNFASYKNVLIILSTRYSPLLQRPPAQAMNRAESYTSTHPPGAYRVRKM